MADLTKLSDKVLAKFARRSETMLMVCYKVCPQHQEIFKDVVDTVKQELVRRNVKWDTQAE